MSDTYPRVTHIYGWLLILLPLERKRLSKFNFAKSVMLMIIVTQQKHENTAS